VALWRARRKAKTDVKELLGVNTLVVIPQYLFHIDLSMAYLGQEQFLVHSFAETLKLLRDDEARFREELGDAYDDVVHANERCVNSGGERRFVDKACRRLRQAGLEPVKCCLMLVSKDFVGRQWDQSGLHSAFSNGLAYEDEAGQRTFITLGAPEMNAHKDHMRRVCAELDVKVAFMADEVWSMARDPVSFMQELSGGLRCLSQSNLEAPLNYMPPPAGAVAADGSDRAMR